MEHNGRRRAAAATVFIPIAGVAAVSNLGSGMLLDRVQPRMLLCGGLFLLAGALLTATRVTSPHTAWTYGVMLGLMQGMQGAVGGGAWAYYFGRANHGAMRGFASTVMVAGSALGPLPFAWGVERFGTYAPLLTVAALLPACVAIRGLFVRSPSEVAAKA